MRLLAITIILLLNACAQEPSHESVCASCTAAKLANAWCDECEVGYVAGMPIPSFMLHEAVDAHGHDINPASIACDSCQIAIATNGFCEPCRMGFFNRRLYFSPLTHALAHGDVEVPRENTCAGCSDNDHVSTPLWCDACNHGRVGNVAFTSRTMFNRAHDEYERLRHSVTQLNDCETCAIAGFLGSECPTHK